VKLNTLTTALEAEQVNNGNTGISHLSTMYAGCPVGFNPKI
jgi:hypothetical protein